MPSRRFWRSARSWCVRLADNSTAGIHLLFWNFFGRSQHRVSCKSELEQRGRWFEVEGRHHVPPPKSESEYDQERIRGLHKHMAYSDDVSAAADDPRMPP